MTHSPLQRVAFAALLALSGVTTLVQAEKRAASTTHTVIIENLQFSPREITVHRGDRVVWVNKDLFPHTVTTASKSLDSGSIAANASWTYVARKPGEYSYGCTFHPTMKGKLTVQ